MDFPPDTLIVAAVCAPHGDADGKEQCRYERMRSHAKRGDEKGNHTDYAERHEDIGAIERRQALVQHFARNINRNVHTYLQNQTVIAIPESARGINESLMEFSAQSDTLKAPMLPRSLNPDRKAVSTRRRVALLFVVLASLITPVLIYRAARQPNTGLATATAADVPAPNSTACQRQLANSRTVGIQAGHYQIDQLPDELSNLQYDFGASSGGVNEVDVNLDVAQRVISLLKNAGITATLLPATVPIDYCANAFVAIHADGNDDPTVYGYKVAPSSWDTDGKAERLSDNIIQDYATATSMALNPTITDNMTQYYAFNYTKFQHAIDPLTPGALIEVGFITNPTDRAVMTQSAQEVAQGIANGIIDYLNGKVAPTPVPTPAE